MIVPPANAQEFSQIVEEITEGSTPDDFAASVDDVVRAFDPFKPLYVAHYKQKKPNIPDDALEKLICSSSNPGRVIKEVANSISAGIYISHGHASIYGSDVHDWAQYEDISRDLPDLRLPVDGFEHFCLLTSSRKTGPAESREIRPFQTP